jgi:hypothetical protein
MSTKSALLNFDLGDCIPVLPPPFPNLCVHAWHTFMLAEYLNEGRGSWRCMMKRKQNSSREVWRGSTYVTCFFFFFFSNSPVVIDYSCMLCYSASIFSFHVQMCKPLPLEFWFLASKLLFQNYLITYIHSNTKKCTPVILCNYILMFTNMFWSLLWPSSGCHTVRI